MPHPLPYLSEVEIESRVGGPERFTELTDDNGDSEPDTEVLEMVQAELDAELDSYFRAGGHTTPLDGAIFRPAKRGALDIANWRLVTRGGRNPSETDRQLYEDAIRYFEGIASGRILLIAATVAQPIIQGRVPFLTLEKLVPYF